MRLNAQFERPEGLEERQVVKSVYQTLKNFEENSRNEITVPLDSVQCPQMDNNLPRSLWSVAIQVAF